MTETERLTILYGDPTLAPPERFFLKAGPLSVTYTADGDLRYIKWGKFEILRRLYAAVRDDGWGTVPAKLTEIERIVGEDSFRIVYDALHTDDAKGISFQWRGTITGDADGTITFDFDGECLTTFRRNRIGICVLHPADLKGQYCTILHTDGTREPGNFPDLIAPHQPFFDIAAITSDVCFGVVATVTFAGDVFEMEDQRNWLDASYKTYSTPLANPLPVEVEAGNRIRQTVTLKLAVAPDAELMVEDDSLITVTLGEMTPFVASFGLMLPSEGKLPRPIQNKYEEWEFGLHLRIDLNGEEPLEAKKALARAMKMAEKLSVNQLIVGLQNARFLTRGFWNMAYNEWGSVIPEDWIFLLPQAEDITKCQKYLDDYNFVYKSFPSNFTELNRTRPATDWYVGGSCGVGWAANPQVHAFDSLSLMETPPMMAEALRTVLSFCETLNIGPVMLSNTNREADKRQYGLIGAAWYLAILSYVCSDYIHTTLCHVYGAHGIMDEKGDLYPVGFALQRYHQLERESNKSLEIKVSDEKRLISFAICSDTKQHVFLINLTPDEQPVLVSNLADAPTTVSYLDETSAATGFSEGLPVRLEGQQANLILRPYAIAEVQQIVEEGQ